MSANDHLQGRLFDPKSTRPQDRGEMSFDKWLQKPDVSYHGSFRPDWDTSSYAHFGDKKAAVERLGNAETVMREGVSARESYYSGEEASEDDSGDYEPEKQVHTGQVHARRLDVAPGMSTDMDANSAHYHNLRAEGYEHWETPGSVRDSISNYIHSKWEDTDTEVPEIQGEVGRVADHLERGKAVKYRNTIEAGDTGVSYVAPKLARTSWESDVLISPHASTTAKHFARDRIMRGHEGVVPFAQDRRPFGPGEVQQLSLQGDYHPGQDRGLPSGVRSEDFRKLPSLPHVSKTQFTTFD